ncbi:MAG: oligosaccharide flippase family protein [Quadrisphaera sp.]
MSAFSTFLFSALIIREEGPATFANIMLIAAVTQMLPFADLGIGAAVVNAFARSDEEVSPGKTLWTCIRICSAPASLVCVIAWVIYALGLWPHLLGDQFFSGGETGVAVSLTLTIFALSLPLGLGVRVLTGLQKNHVAVAIAATASPITLACAYVYLKTSLPPVFLAALPALGVLAASALTFVLAVRAWRKEQHQGLGRSMSVRSILAMGLPMALINIGIPLLFQSHRLIISHRLDDHALAQFTIMMQLYAPAAAFIGVAGTALWPVFSRGRTSADRGAQLFRDVLKVFIVGSALLAVGFSALSPLVVRLISDGSVQVAPATTWSFALLLAIQTVQTVPAMYLTDAKGLAYQARTMLMAATVSFAISLFLTPLVGVFVAPLSIAIALLLFQCLPAMRRTQRFMREQPATHQASTVNLPSKGLSAT